MRSIGVVTVARSDYGLYLPIMRRIQEDPDLQLQLIVGGMHLAPEFGMTVNDIERDGFSIDERVDLLLSSDSPQGIAKSMALGTMGFAQAFGRLAPDILLPLGDRFEIYVENSATSICALTWQSCCVIMIPKATTERFSAIV